MSSSSTSSVQSSDARDLSTQHKQNDVDIQDVKAVLQHMEAEANACGAFVATQLYTLPNRGAEYVLRHPASNEVARDVAKQTLWPAILRARLWVLNTCERVRLEVAKRCSTPCLLSVLLHSRLHTRDPEYKEWDDEHMIPPPCSTHAHYGIELFLSDGLASVLADFVRRIAGEMACPPEQLVKFPVSMYMMRYIVIRAITVDTPLSPNEPTPAKPASDTNPVPPTDTKPVPHRPQRKKRHHAHRLTVRRRKAKKVESSV